MQFSAMKMAHAPPGHHSVMGRPSYGGLSFPEYVIYRGEQVRYLIFSINRFSGDRQWLLFDGSNINRNSTTVFLLDQLKFLVFGGS